MNNRLTAIIAALGIISSCAQAMVYLDDEPLPSEEKIVVRKPLPSYNDEEDTTRYTYDNVSNWPQAHDEELS